MFVDCVLEILTYIVSELIFKKINNKKKKMLLGKYDYIITNK